MSLWNGVDNRKVSEAKKEGYDIISSAKKKVRYFESGGYIVKTIEGENITKGNLPDADAYIVSFWNSDNAMESIHTVAMRKTSDGKYELFNYKSNNQNNSIKDKDFADLLEFEGNIPLALYCISK